jgi:hypothetical protein
MILEHLVYTAALAILVSIFFIKYTGRNPTIIIFLMTGAPDIDYFVQWGQCYIWQCNGIIAVHHGDFHNIAALVAFTIIGAYVFSKWGGFKWTDAAICSFIGYSAHLWEDWFVYLHTYAFLWPFTDTHYGADIIHESMSLWGLGDPHVFEFGFLLLGIAILIKMYFCGKDWIQKEYANGKFQFSNLTNAYNYLVLMAHTKLTKKE